jgi:hypothetical protein
MPVNRRFMNIINRNKVFATRATQPLATLGGTTGHLVDCFALVHCLGGSYDEDSSRLVANWSAQATDLQPEGSGCDIGRS